MFLLMISTSDLDEKEIKLIVECKHVIWEICHIIPPVRHKKTTATCLWNGSKYVSTYCPSQVLL